MRTQNNQKKHLKNKRLKIEFVNGFELILSSILLYCHIKLNGINYEKSVSDKQKSICIWIFLSFNEILCRSNWRMLAPHIDSLIVPLDVVTFSANRSLRMNIAASTIRSEGKKTFLSLSQFNLSFAIVWFVLYIVRHFAFFSPFFLLFGCVLEIHLHSYRQID